MVPEKQDQLKLKPLTMKNFAPLKTLLLLVFLVSSVNFFAQDKASECNIRYNQFKPNVVNKNYDLAYEDWMWVMDNCPELTINTYKYGLEIAEYRFKNAANEADKLAAKQLVDKVYEQRLKYFPAENPAKVYSDWGMFKYKNKEVESSYFNLFDKAYKTDATDMGVQAIPIYFQGIIDRNKDSNVQFIFDMYDNLSEVVKNKTDNFSEKLDELTKLVEAGTELSDRQQNNKHAYEVNLDGLGQVDDLITDMAEEFATCDRLIPLYESEYEANKTDITWLKRSVNRLGQKGCTDSNFYDKIVETFVNVDGSCDSYLAYANLLLKKGDENKALEYFKKAVDCQDNNYKKADILYNIAIIMKNKGRSSDARSYANKALEARPSLGKAHLLIANLYAANANACGGGDPFVSRMVFQLALEKAYRAKAVDPSIAGQADRSIANYASKAPTKAEIFNSGRTPGTYVKIGCWIGESVMIPNK